MRDSIKNKTMEKTKVKQSVFPQLDTDFPSENFRYSRNAAKGVMMEVPVPTYEILTRESAWNCALLIAKYVCDLKYIFK